MLPHNLHNNATTTTTTVSNITITTTKKFNIFLNAYDMPVAYMY